jgi:hypothetical protein
VYFRAATTHEGESFITVFDREMNQVGFLRGLGKPGERIYSVRFNRETAVVVTFLDNDPLYVIDLTNPYSPKIISELEVSGIFDYLHFLRTNSDLVFAVGRAQNSGGGSSGVKVSLYDISYQPANEIYFDFPDAGDYNYSEATLNHRAIMYFMPNLSDPNVTPVEIFAFSVNWWTSGQIYSALMYYVVSGDGTVERLQVGYIATNSSDRLRRSIMSNGYLYLIGDRNIERYFIGSDLLPDLSTRQVLKIIST